MATKRFDVTAVTGEYTDREGNKKLRYLKCGVVLETDKGLRLKLDAVPTSGDGWFMLMEPRQENRQPQRQVPANGDDGSDIPF